MNQQYVVIDDFDLIIGPFDDIREAVAYCVNEGIDHHTSVRFLINPVG